MAHMLPPDAPLATPGRKAERELWDALRHGLTDDFYVYYGLHYLDDRAEQGEVDFLILHRELGMLVVECKGGGVTRRSDGQWVRSFQGRETPMHSPFEQAQRQMHTMRGELEQRMEGAFGGRLPFVHGYAVALPFLRARDANLPLEAQQEIVLTADHLGGVRSWVERAFAFWREAARGPGPAPLSPSDFKWFRKHVLHPELRLVETLGARLSVESASMARLSDEQVQVLKGCLDSKRMRISGGAGTGKTALALEAARRFSRGEGKRSLLICFNRLLAAHLAATVGAAGDSERIDVTTFHALCRRAFDALGLPYEPPSDGDAASAQRFWDKEAPEALLEALAAEALPRYDAIIVDEAQDFHAHWATVLEDCLKSKDEGRLLVFFDPGQKIFDRKTGLSEAPSASSLTTNFRNARALASVVRELGRIEMEPHPRAPVGEPPHVHVQAGPTRARAQLDELVRTLIRKNQVSPEQITILTPHRRENSTLKDVAQLAGLELTSSVEDREGKLLHTTIGAFKGLESDVVILLDVDPEDARSDRRARYVGASRAKLVLHVFAKGDWLAG